MNGTLYERKRWSGKLHIIRSKEKIISHVATEKLKKIGAKIRAIVIRALGNQLFC